MASTHQEVPVLLRVKGKGVHTAIIIWLAAVPLLLLGCVQAEADPNPTAITTDVPTLNVANAASSPTPTPRPLPRRHPLQRRYLLLRQPPHQARPKSQ